MVLAIGSSVYQLRKWMKEVKQAKAEADDGDGLSSELRKHVIDVENLKGTKQSYHDGQWQETESLSKAHVLGEGTHFFQICCRFRCRS